MIIPNKKYKIALIGFRLSNGGSEKVMANLSVFLDKQNIEIHNIIIEDGVSYPFSGKLINIGLIKNKTNDIFNKLKRLNALRKHLRENQFDFIIDFRYRTKFFQEFILIKGIYNARTIFTIHSYLIEQYMPNNPILTRFLYGNAYSIIAITKQMESLVIDKHKLNNVKTIYNTVNFDEINQKQNELIDINFKYIIAIGQFVNNVKQFDKLIKSYANSILYKNEIHLVILGEGDLKKELENVALENNVLDKVHFLGFQNNPYKYIKKAKFLVLCSKNEGMPNVILESLACETPVVSFDCFSGPREMIINKENGILVENQNFERLTEAMNLFIENEELYCFCKHNTLQSVQKFSLNTIGEQWLNVMNIKF